MSEQLGLGSLIPEDAVQHRDCIHIACVPVRAAELLRPGQKVGVVGIDGETFIGAGLLPITGVVDPFLNRPVGKGQRCWLYLEPGSITALRHDWTHPAFPKE